MDRSWLVYPNNNKLEIWDVVSCHPLRAPLTGHEAQIHDITFSHDGTKFCSRDINNCILVWDATTYNVIGVPIQVPPFIQVWMVSLWADKVIACDGTHQVSLWDIATGILVADHEPGYLSDRSDFMDLQGAYLVIGDDLKIASIVYTITGEDVTEKYTHGRDITNVIFSPDNKVVCLCFDNCISILDVHSGNVIGDLDVDLCDVFLHSPVAFSPNGRQILAITRMHIAIHDLDTGKLVYGPFDRTYTIEGTELSLDETRLLVWNSQSSFEVLNIPSGNVIASSKLGPSPHDAVISSNGDHVVATYSDAITIFDILSLSSHCYNISIESVAPSPNSCQLLFAMSDNTLQFSMDISLTNSIVLDEARSPAAFSPKGSMIASAYMDHTLQLWDTKDAKAIGKPLEGH